MRRSARGPSKEFSQICKPYSRNCFSRLGRTAALCLAVGIAGVAWSAPEDDYRRGEQAFRGGDVVTAMAALRRAADAGHAPSQVLLGDILDQAEFDAEALAWYRRAAEQGDAAGEYSVGGMYFSGEGVKKDLSQAYFWFLRAAEKKYAPATIALANAYIRAEQGEIPVSPDKSVAADWLRKAAALDYLPALEALAQAYRAGGFGISPDAMQAEHYVARAQALKKKGTPDKGRKNR
ncbi:MAG: sel1 repeat family protein [Betaproteobacteria bacterium]|nr:sel1 repeat family protein [Betaproteobacteria bacterium]